MQELLQPFQFPQFLYDAKDSTGTPLTVSQERRVMKMTLKKEKRSKSLGVRLLSNLQE